MYSASISWMKPTAAINLPDPSWPIYFPPTEKRLWSHWLARHWLVRFTMMTESRLQAKNMIPSLCSVIISTNITTIALLLMDILSSWFAKALKLPIRKSCKKHWKKLRCSKALSIRKRCTPIRNMFLPWSSILRTISARAVSPWTMNPSVVWSSAILPRRRVRFLKS